jgi:dihydrofolate reductase
MADVVYYVATSVDGYIAAPDGGVEWLEPFQAPGEDYGYGEFFGTLGGMVMGRRTFDQALGFGPWLYEGLPCRVVTSRPLADAPAGVGVSASPAEAMAALGAGRVWLVGGTTLFQGFREAGLIREYVLTIVPVILGDGIPLFPKGPGAGLRLLETRRFDEGLVQLRYAVVGAGGGAPGG